MKPSPFRYARPESLNAVLELLAAHGGDAKVIAGGQSLVPLLNLRLARPSVLVDLALIPELKVLRREKQALAVGALMRHRAAELSPVVGEACPLLPQALRHVGHLQIRSRGTIGGSLAHADPAAELVCVAVALDAQLVAVSTRGRRVVSAGEFFVGPYMTVLEDDEVLVEARFPILSGARFAFLEVARRSGDFALAGVAAAVAVAKGTQAPLEVRLAAIGVDGVPRRLGSAEAVISNGGLRPDTIAEAAATAAASVEAGDAPPHESRHRRRLVETLVGRALEEVRA